MQRLKPYIYQREGWPTFAWDDKALSRRLGAIRQAQGRLVGRMESLGFALRDEAVLKTLTQDVVKTSEIEGENLDQAQVRSSLARKLGMDVSGLLPSDRNIDGVVEMMLDATTRYNDELTHERLFGWHAALFPTGRSNMQKIIVGNYRDDAHGPMQVVSGIYGKQTVYFQAPDASSLQKEVDIFLNWVNTSKETDEVIKAAVAHLWFITLHPFEDGNGRMARALADLLLARADKTHQRFYSMSAQIQKQRKVYYNILEETQQGSLDITKWIEWFITTLQGATVNAETTLSQVIFKHKFWSKHASTTINERQCKVLNKLLNGFDGNLQRNRYARITKTSKDTALRDIQDLVKKDILIKASSSGRSTYYVLADL